MRCRAVPQLRHLRHSGLALRRHPSAGGALRVRRVSGLASAAGADDHGETEEDAGEEEKEEEEEEEWDAAALPFLVAAAGRPDGDDGDGAEVSVDVLVVEEAGGVNTGDASLDAETLAEILEKDAETLVRLLLDPPEGSGLPKDIFPDRAAYAELSVALCSDDHIKSLNAEWRGKDAPTDVLSFPQEAFGNVVVLGDCVISVDTAKRQAAEVGHTLLDECRVLLVHGLLHLAGFDHEEGEGEAAEMARYEDALIALLVADDRGENGGEGRRGLVASSLTGLRKYNLGFEQTGARGAGTTEDDTSRPPPVTPVFTSAAGSRRADCLVLDLDGTLLNRDCVITPRTAEALREATAAGVAVFIATGKARPAAIRAAATAGLDGADGIVSRAHPGVFLQGLDVYGRGGAGLYKAEMPRDVVMEAFAEIYCAGSDRAGWSDIPLALTAFCGDACATLAEHVLLEELSAKYHEPPSVPWDDVESLMRAAGGSETSSGVQKLLLMGPSAAAIDEVRPRWEATFGERSEVTQAVSNMLEVLPRGNNKGRGVSMLLEHLDMDFSRVVAVGDGENDVDMLKLVGCGVAMGNAGAKARDAADHVLEKTNDEDGVAEAIQRFVL